MRAMTFYQAIRFFLAEGTGTVIKKDGTRIVGPCIDLVDANNDPNGVGYISIRIKPGLIYDVSANEFAGIEVETEPNYEAFGL